MFVQQLAERADSDLELKIILDNQGANRSPEEDGEPTGFPEKLFESYRSDCIRWDSKSTTMHRKVAVVDGTEVFIGSTNWTKNGFENNREIDVLLHDPDIASQIIVEFKKDWDIANENFPDKSKPPETEEYYVGNSNSMKFHRPLCKYIDNIDESHKVIFKIRQEAIDAKYTPCGTCKP